MWIISSLPSPGQISQCLFIQQEVKFYRRTFHVCTSRYPVWTRSNVCTTVLSCLHKYISKKQNQGSIWHQIRMSGRKKKNHLEAIKKLMLLTHIWRTCFVWLKLNKALKIGNISLLASGVPIACPLYFNFHFLFAETSYWKLPFLFPMGLKHFKNCGFLNLQCKVLTFTTTEFIFFYSLITE